MILHCLNKYRDIGLLILRIGIGTMFVIHGCPKILGGPDKWEMIGGAISVFGIKFIPTFWGFMAAFAEFGGGIFIIIGFIFRPFCILMLFTMIVAASMHIGNGHPFVKYSHAVESGILFLSMIFIGPGIYSIDEVLSQRKK